MRKQLLVLVSALALLAGCGEKQTASEQGATPEPQKTFEWKLVTSWPKNYPALGTGPENFAERVEAMSGGRLKIKVYGAGDLVPAMEVFDAVSRGTAEMGHAASYYWKGKIPSASFFTATPFGLNAREMNAWLHYGGGLELWREAYEPFDLIPFAGGSTGVQMGGWFREEIASMKDLKGLKMRIPGIGGEIMSRAGVQTVNIPGGELYTALQTNVIDAADWVGPYNDLAFGFHQVADYYYYPGWHEGGSILEFTVNREAWESLHPDLQAIVRNATRAINQDMLDEFTARNHSALTELIEEHGIQVKPFPDDVLRELARITEQLLAERKEEDPLTARVLESQEQFLEGVMRYHRISEEAYYNARRGKSVEALEK